MAAASAGYNAEYDSDIDGDFEPLVVDGLKNLQQRLSTTMSTRAMSCSGMIPQRKMQRRTWSVIMSTVQGDGGVLFQVVDHQGLTLLERVQPKHRRQLRSGEFAAKHTQTRCKGSTGRYLVLMPPQKLNTLVW